MKSFHLCASLAILFVAVTCKAEDILMQVQSVVEGRATADGKPIIVESTEVIVTPGSSFHTRTRNGDKWMMIQGKLSQPVDGKYYVEYSHKKNVKPALDHYGVLSPVVNVTAIRTENVEMEKPMSIGLTIMPVPWKGARGRVRNSSTYDGLVRCELILKPAKREFEEWPRVLPMEDLSPVPVKTTEWSIGHSWFSGHKVRTIEFRSESRPRVFEISLPGSGSPFALGDRDLVPKAPEAGN